MGKPGDLWDDSALINAFDDAIHKYKTIKVKQGGDTDNSAESERVSGTKRSSMVAETEKINTSNIEQVTREVNDVSRVGEDRHEDLGSSEVQEQPANDHATEDMPWGYYGSQSAEEYNDLVAQYYKIEEERQKILQKLQQYDGWNYPNFGAAWPQQHSMPYAQAGGYSCSSYTCPPIGPCCVAPSCNFGMTVCNKSDISGAIVPDKSCHIGNCDTVNTAMEAGKNAESFTRTEFCLSSDGNKGKEDDRSVAQTASQGTDLPTVLNAWYSAGVYTGKYLTEQSLTKK